MSIVGRWTWGKKARLVTEALRAAGVSDTLVAVVERPALARLLAGGRRVDAIGAGQRGALSSDYGAVVGEPQGEAELERWVRALRPGGAIVLIGRGPREEASRWVLCAGLVDIEQRVAGRWFVTSGRRR
jgi:hypothetical protein